MDTLKENKDQDSQKPKKRRDKKKAQEFLIIRTLRLGSNEDGSPKEHYIKGKTVSLDDSKKIEQLKNLKVI